MDWLTFKQRRRANHQGWAIYIDVEGFSKFLDTDSNEHVGRGLGGLQRLTTALWNIGALAYPGKDPGQPAERLFMHQFGDGYLIWPDSWEDTFDRPLMICVAVMRSLMVSGTAIKASISCGSLGDVLGVYAHEIKDQVEDGAARIGSGVMRFTQVLGTALSNAYKCGSRLRGAQLIVDHRAIPKKSFPSWLAWSSAAAGADDTWSAVDWVHGTSPQLERLCQVSKIRYPTPTEVETAVVSYMQMSPRPPKEWCELTIRSTNLSSVSLRNQQVQSPLIGSIDSDPIDSRNNSCGSPRERRR